MAAIIKDEFKTNSLTRFIDSINTSSLYLGIGRSYAWDPATGDAAIPTPTNAAVSSTNDWADMLSMKLLTPSDVSQGLFKEKWQANVVYDTYRHDWDGHIVAKYNGFSAFTPSPKSISDVKCYVVTTNGSIYLCLKRPVTITGTEIEDNVKSIYSPDTGVTMPLNPAHANSAVSKTADGYVWKFMGTLESVLSLAKFSSKFYHPIKNFTAAPNSLEPGYQQWLAQVNSGFYKGGIYTINVLSVGANYNGGIAGTYEMTDAELVAGQFRVLGDGVGIKLTVVYGVNGSIVDIIVTDPGVGYTFANIIVASGPANGAGASFDIIYTPMRGLGVKPATDLVARHLLLNAVLVGAEEGDFTVENNFRKLMLIENPLTFAGTTVATARTLDATLTLAINPVGLTQSMYPVDSIVTGASSGAKAQVVDFNTTTGKIRVIRTALENNTEVGANEEFDIGETLNCNAEGAGGQVITALINPEVAKHSGDIIYTEYLKPITRGELQTEDLKLVIKF